ncbi:MAG: hypothetical protein WDN00_15690 [Limisphaerales bacterium]
MHHLNSIHAPFLLFGGVRIGWIIGVLLFGFIITNAKAGVTFYTTSGTFNPAVGSFILRGTETWSTATATSASNMADPLIPGVANGPFPTGSSVAVGVRAQGNSLGNNPATLAPGPGLFYAPAGFVGFSGNAQPTKQVSANKTNASFDLIFTNIAQNIPRAASLSPMYYRILSPNNSVTLTVRVYNQANTLLGSTTVAGVPDCLETAYLGIVTTGSDTLGRINIWATTQDVSGADNIAVYGAAPIASTLKAISRTGNNFTFKLDGQAGQRYAIQSGTNLVNWQSVQTNTLATNSIQLTITATSNLRFYRAQWLP